MQNKTDEELIRLFLEGSKDVFEELFKRYYKKVFNLCLRFCNGDVTLAEETAQETFLQVYKSLERFKFKSSFYTWLYRVTFNTCSISIKKVSRLRFNPLDSVGETVEHRVEKNPTDLILKKEYNSSVAEVLSQLPEEQKQVMLLGPVMGYSYAEIAETIGESVTVVKGRLFRARQNFKKKFKNRTKLDNLTDARDTNLSGE
jgi:RNA polymerase sigma-70 factor (ECF subfamily)